MPSPAPQVGGGLTFERTASVRRAVWIGGIAVMGAALFAYVFFGQERPSSPHYRTVPVERGAVLSVVTATGTINPVVLVQVGSQVSGKIQSLHADFNSVVQAGQVVARIDPAPFQARRDQAGANLVNARAALLKARADAAQRERELTRVQALIDQQFVSQNDLDVALTAREGAQAQLAVADAQVQQAEATLRAAELDLTYTVIRSPVDGVVIDRTVEVGQTIAASFATPTLFLIARDLTQMQVEANVSEADIGGIAEGNEASFTVDAYPGARFRGVVKQVRHAPITVQNVVTYKVIVGVSNDDLRLKPGMTANVSITVARREDVLKVPNAALRFIPPKSGRPDDQALAAGGARSRPGSEEQHPDAAGKARPVASRTLWKMGPSGLPEPATIVVGISDGNATEVVSGDLAAGDRVIIGLEALPGERRRQPLPPGFGSEPRRSSSRERGL